MDQTVLERQKRRLNRLNTEGIQRSTVMVHEDCRAAFEKLRPLFSKRAYADLLNQLVSEGLSAPTPVNVAQVKQLSPFRYPGGKTWLVPHARKWLTELGFRPSVFVEPFAGGAMIGLTVANEKLSEQVFLGEIDSDVSAVWQLIFGGTLDDLRRLCLKIQSFQVSAQSVKSTLSNSSGDLCDRAFRTIIKNRMQRGGIMASGAGLVKSGEAGRGLDSRWYPETLVNRIRAISELRSTVTFEMSDAFASIRRFASDRRAVFFIDPPYTASGKKAGSRLYTHSEVDHVRLFSAMASVKGKVLMTYDDSSGVREMASRYGFSVSKVPMKNTHHRIMNELLITKS